MRTGIALAILLLQVASAKPWSGVVAYEQNSFQLAEGKSNNISYAMAVDDAEEPFNPETAWMRIMSFNRNHQDTAKDSIAWLIAGQCLNLVGFIILMYSEIKMVMMTRDADFRVHLKEDDIERPSLEQLQQSRSNEQSIVDQRPYLSTCGAVLLYVGSISIMVPLCNVLHLLGISTGVGFWPCWMVVIFGSLCFTFCLVLFIVGIVWSCTRPWAAAVLLAIAVTGDLCCSSLNPLLIMLWGGLCGTLGYWYFSWYPKWCQNNNHPTPEWCQNLGPMEISLDISDWGDTLQKASRAAMDDVKAAVPYQFESFSERDKGGHDGVTPEADKNA